MPFLCFSSGIWLHTHHEVYGCPRVCNEDFVSTCLLGAIVRALWMDLTMNTTDDSPTILLFESGSHLAMDDLGQSFCLLPLTCWVLGFGACAATPGLFIF